MLFYFDGQGKSIKISSEPIYQGSNNVGVIYFIAPFDNSSSVTATFTLPDGTVADPVYLDQSGEIINSKTPFNPLNYAVWRTSLADSLTAKNGVVFVTFTAYNSSQIITTEQVSFTVLKGRHVALPTTPTENVYQSILREIAHLKNRLFEVITDEDIENIPTLAEKERWNAKQDALTFDNVPTQNSANPIKSSGVYTALSGKQNTLTFDDAPTQNSVNPVKSGGVYSALAGCVSKTDSKVFQNLSANNWVTDSTYSDFGYKSEIALSGVTQDFFAQVVFAPEQALSGNYCPTCQTLDGKVVIYAKTNSEIVIPTIVCRRV